MQDNKNQKGIEYVLGIDFGHGETAAALCCLDWEKPSGLLDLPKAVDIMPGLKVVQSVIGYDAEGRTFIGDQASLGLGHNVAHLQLGWKKRPSQMDQAEEKATIDFMKAVYLGVRASLTQLTDDNHFVYIAHPSGWPKTEVDQYLNLVKNAGLCRADKTKESRAALVLARMDPASGLSSAYHLEKGILVCDFGSSTLDFTYCTLNPPKDDGVELGASRIDKLLLEHALEHSSAEDRQAIEKVFSIDPVTKVRCEMEARHAKEEFYLKGEMYPISNPVTVRKKPRLLLDIDVSSEIMLSLLGEPGHKKENQGRQIRVQIDGKETEGAWRVLLRMAVDSAKRKLICRHVNSPSAVLLTGSASRMSFVCEDLKAILGSEVMIFRDQEPSTTIARGIAFVGRADVRTENMAQQCLAEVSATLDKTIEKNIPELIKKISEKATHLVADQIIFPELRRWRDRKVVLLKETEDNIRQAAEKSLQGEGFKQRVREIVSKWIQSMMNEYVLPSLEKVFESYGYNREVARIQIEDELHASAKSVNIDTEDLGEILDVSKVIGGIVRMVILTIGHYLSMVIAFNVWLIMLYIVASILATTGVGTPMAVLLSAGATGIAWKLATKGGSFVNALGGGVAKLIGGDVREKDYSKEKRLKIFTKFIEKKDEMLAKVAEQIKQQFLEDPNLSKDASQLAQKFALERIDCEIKQARLLID